MVPLRIAPPEEGHAGGTEAIVALFRIWHAARERYENPLPQMSAVLGRTSSPELAPACDSFFALTEACLGRRLQASPPQSPTFSPDEEALLETLRQVPALLAIGPNSVLPHGLPGALQWAALAVLNAIDALPLPQTGTTAPEGRCPFLASRGRATGEHAARLEGDARSPPPS